MKTVIIATFVMVLSLVSVFVVAGLTLPTNESGEADANDQFINVKGSKIRFRMVGQNGPTVIMLHGFGGDLSGWEPITNKISCARIVTLDLLGFGRSDKPLDIKYDLETQKKYLLAFMEKLHIDKAFLMGTSMGASIALWTASRSPEKVEGLVVFAPSAYPGSMRHRWPGDLFYRRGILNRMLLSIVNSSLYQTFFPRSLAHQALDVTASYDSTFIEGLASVRQPILLIWSRGDKRVPYRYSEYYLKLLPQAQFIEAPEQNGHHAAAHPTSDIIQGICKIVNQF
jgi:pimeloyl-ACP methyl ester carboxylesterase